MAKAAGVSDGSVQRIWAAHGLEPPPGANVQTRQRLKRGVLRELPISRRRLTATSPRRTEPKALRLAADPEAMTENCGAVKQAIASIR